MGYRTNNLHEISYIEMGDDYFKALENLEMLVVSMQEKKFANADYYLSQICSVFDDIKMPDNLLEQAIRRIEAA